MVGVGEMHQRRRQRALRRGQVERRHVLLDRRGDRLQLGEALDARLRLGRLRGLGLEAVDEALQVRALGLLLGLGRGLEPGLLGPALLEVVVAAGVEFELAAGDVQDRVDRVVQELAVVADDQGRVRVALAAAPPARARLRDRGSWWARRAAACRARRRAPRRAPRACASRRRTPPSAASRSATEKPRPARISPARAGARSASISMSRP